MHTVNPELKLIDLLATRIQEDQRFLDRIGGGTPSIDSLEDWWNARAQSESRFLRESGHMLAEMRRERLARPAKRAVDEDVQQDFGARRSHASTPRPRSWLERRRRERGR